jgi:hypothetical protein
MLQEDATQTKHPRSLLPAVHQRAALQTIEREVSQDSKKIKLFHLFQKNNEFYLLKDLMYALAKSIRERLT